MASQTPTLERPAPSGDIYAGDAAFMYDDLARHDDSEIEVLVQVLRHARARSVLDLGSSAPTVPASPPCCASSPGSTARMPASWPSTGSSRPTVSPAAMWARCWTPPGPPAAHGVRPPARAGPAAGTAREAGRRGARGHRPRRGCEAQHRPLLPRHAAAPGHRCGPARPAHQRHPAHPSVPTRLARTFAELARMCRTQEPSDSPTGLGRVA